jgi:hypothetical protein
MGWRRKIGGGGERVGRTEGLYEQPRTLKVKQYERETRGNIGVLYKLEPAKIRR